MTDHEFRKLARALPGACEKSHFGQPDFRVKDKIFATLQDRETAVVKLTREQQEMMTSAEPMIFAAVKGGWGLKGWTRVNLAGSDEATVKSALQAAWRNVAPKKLDG